MAELPTNEECARRLMDIFRKLDVRAGKGVVGRAIFTNWAMDTLWKGEDLERAITYATEQGWVETLENNNGLKLTDKGFAEL